MAAGMFREVRVEEDPALPSAPTTAPAAAPAGHAEHEQSQNAAER
jgi:hypothetical protein